MVEGRDKKLDTQSNIITVCIRCCFYVSFTSYLPSIPVTPPQQASQHLLDISAIIFRQPLKLTPNQPQRSSSVVSSTIGKLISRAGSPPSLQELYLLHWRRSDGLQNEGHTQPVNKILTSTLIQDGFHPPGVPPQTKVSLSPTFFEGWSYGRHCIEMD